MASAALARRTPQPHRSVSPRHRFADEGERNGEQYSARLRKAISPYSVARRQKAETLVAQERARAGQLAEIEARARAAEDASADLHAAVSRALSERDSVSAQLLHFMRHAESLAVKLGEAVKREESLRREVTRCRVETSLVASLAYHLEDELVEKSFESVAEAQKVVQSFGLALGHLTARPHPHTRTHELGQFGAVWRRKFDSARHFRTSTALCACHVHFEHRPCISSAVNQSVDVLWRTRRICFSQGAPLKSLATAERLLVHLRSAQRALLDARLGGEGRIHLPAHAGQAGESRDHPSTRASGGSVDGIGLRCACGSTGGDTGDAGASGSPYAQAQRGDHPCTAPAYARPFSTTACATTHCGGLSSRGCGYDGCLASPRSPLRGHGRGGASGEGFFGSPERGARAEAMSKQREALLQGAFGGAGRCAMGNGADVDSGACAGHAFTGAGRAPEPSSEGHGGEDSIILPRRTCLSRRDSSRSIGSADATFAAPASPRAMSTLEALRATANAPRSQPQTDTRPVAQPTASAATAGNERAAHEATNPEPNYSAVGGTLAAGSGAARRCYARDSPVSHPHAARPSPNPHIARPSTLSLAESAPPLHLSTRNGTGARRRLSCGGDAYGSAGACEVAPLTRSASASVISAPNHQFGVRAPGAAGGNASRAAPMRAAHSGRGSPMPQARAAQGSLSRFGSAAGGSHGDLYFDDDSPYVTMANAAWAAGGRRQNTGHRRTSTPATVWNGAWR